MKRVLFLLPLLILLSIPFPVFAEHPPEFKPTILNLMEQSASSLFSSKDSRALFTLLLAFDYSSENTAYKLSSISGGSSYVGIDYEKELVSLFLLTEEDELHLIVYSPNIETASYNTFESVSELAIEAVMENHRDRFYRNSKTALSKATEAIIDYFE